MSRRAARSQAMEQVYKTLVAEDTDSLITEELDESDRAYADALVKGIDEHKDELMEMISKNSTRFALQRVFKVDLAIMLIASYEIHYADELKAICDGELNKAISCSEAVLMAKKYSTVKSPAYINGVLGKIN